MKNNCKISAPEPSLARATTHITSLWDAAIRNLLKIRFRSLWTAARAKQINYPYRTAAGNNKTDVCHICHRRKHSQRDTQGHLLSACTHPDLAALYIKRHNLALCMIQRSVNTHSDLGNCYTIMDATTKEDLPPGVASNRIPPWVLPSISDEVHNRLRPDLLIFQGTPLTNASHHPRHMLYVMAPP
jgi:hypothetical protein